LQERLDTFFKVDLSTGERGIGFGVTAPKPTQITADQDDGKIPDLSGENR